MVCPGLDIPFSVRFGPHVELSFSSLCNFSCLDMEVYTKQEGDDQDKQIEANNRDIKDLETMVEHRPKENQE